jgi:hypothetical protein
MKYLILAATALIGLACSSHSQTIKSLGYDTTNGQVIYGGTNPLTFTNPLQFESGVRAATRTNLGLGATNNVEFRRLKMIAANATDNGDDATLWLDTSGTNKFASMRLSGTGGGAEKYNAYLQGGSFGLQVSADRGFRVLSGPTAGTGSVLFAVNSSGNATLNGTANLAPSQTASSGSSLMTRDLTDQRQIDRMIAGPRMVWLTTFNGWSTQATGGSVNQNVYLRASSGTNAFNFAVARNFQLGDLFSGPNSQINFSKAGSFGTAYSTRAQSVRTGISIIYYGGAYNYVPSSGSAVVDPATKGFGWKIQNESIVATMFGTNYLQLATNSAVLSTNNPQKVNIWLFIEWDGAGNAAWYINGSECASTTNAPTGLSSVDQNYLIIGSVADTNLASANLNDISAILLDREP